MRWVVFAVALLLTACSGSDEPSKKAGPTPASNEGVSAAVCDLLGTSERDLLAGTKVSHDVSRMSLQPGEYPQPCQFSDDEFANRATTIIGYEAAKASTWAKRQFDEGPVYPLVRDSAVFGAAANESVGSETALESVNDDDACRFWDVYRKKLGWESVAGAHFVNFEGGPQFKPEIRGELCRDGVFTSVAVLSEELTDATAEDFARRTGTTLGMLSRRAASEGSTLD